jgi:two-component system, NtrC family, response regulator AtoC
MFRDDLFYRLNVVRISVPPLRERPGDIPLLAGHLLERISARMGISDILLQPEALEKLSGYSFPGNVRELENIIERALIYRRGRELSVADFELRSAVIGEECGNPGISAEKFGGNEASGSLKKAENEAILRALQKWNGNRTKAAAKLGISRRTILNKIKKYGIRK